MKQEHLKITSIGHDRVYPPVGCAQRSYYISKYLSEHFRVTLIGHSGAITQYRKHQITDTFNIIEIPGMVASIIGAVGFAITNQPLFDPIVAWISTKSPQLVKNYMRFANDADILFFEGCWHYPLIKYIRNRDKKLIVYDAHNVEYLLKKQVYKGIFSDVLLPKIFALERQICRDSDIILATCENEKKAFIELYDVNAECLFVIPNCVEVPKDKRNVIEKTILFIGGAYFANFEAVRYVNDILAKKLPDFTFRIVGRAGMVIKKPQPNVEIYGLVSEKKKNELLQSSEIAINPIIHGAGINVKMLEYLAYGIPVITTPLGARGFSSYPFIVSDLNEFAENIVNLSHNSDLKTRLSKNGRELIKKNYDYHVIGNRVYEILTNEIKRKIL